jgi:hypothetical protein
MQGLGLIIFGTEGVGKTTFAVRFPGPVEVLSTRSTGVSDLQHVHGEIPDNVEVCEIDDFSELKYKTEHTKAKTLVVEELHGLQEYLFKHVCKMVYDGVWEGKDGFSSYYRGQRVDSPIYLQEYLDIVNKKREEGTNVIFVGHSSIVDVANPSGPDYMSHVLSLDDGDKGGVRSVFTRWAQAILFLNIDVTINRITATDKNTKTITAGKAKDEDTRLIYTTKSPSHSAKNRLKLPPIISMGETPDEAFANFWKHVPQYYKDNTTK